MFTPKLKGECQDHNGTEDCQDQDRVNVSRACKVFGYSRASFYRFNKLHDSGGGQALPEMDKTRPNLTNHVTQEVESAVCEMAIDQTVFDLTSVPNDLKKRAILVSPARVCNVWMRHDLETFKKRLTALEAKMAHLFLTERPRFQLRTISSPTLILRFRSIPCGWTNVNGRLT